jgi:cytochrome bd-type quinol oxidase subunit 2
VVHGGAHKELGVELNAWQTIYVTVVILVTPLVAAVLLWTRRTRLGFLLLVLSMFGSLIFGAYYHYVAVSPDHVSHLPPGDAQGLFRATALLLLLTEVLGLVAGLLGLRVRGRRIEMLRT